ncbi:LamG-like jellyroll fold domain-containing protein [Paraflavitalea soli]|nr:LamG-like jellyroll fold domain-containing protein [Paraflavitalea soli]
MKRLQNITAFILLLIAGLSLPGMAFASNEPYSARPLKGNQLRKDSSNLVKDTVYFNSTLKPLQTTFKVRNLVTFKVNEFANLKLPDTFEITVSFKVYFIRNVGSSPVSDSSGVISLNIKSYKNGRYTPKAFYTFTGGHQAQVKITNMTVVSGNLADVENSLMLENELFVTREYAFDCTNNAVSTLNTPVYNTDKGELDVSWNSQRAADEYDLEWTYIDDSAIANYYMPGSTVNFDALKIFNNNATRVSITQSRYLIPLLYDGSGHLFYRVRAVQTKANNQRIESIWSTTLGDYPFTGHENKLNWQATTSFAEEGKRKAVVQYFDGSLRNRQTVTKDNTTDTTLVAETLYDYQGRPAIQVLPTPSLSSLIKYTPNFNLPVNGTEYDKDRYDGLLVDSCYCKQGAPAMGTLSGASKYYSPSNPLVNTSFHKYIPDAKGFPFAETRYTPDNTSRISLQSGVGADFQIDSGRATRYFYSAADQEELDVLFGTEVGNASHYFKNMVRDANGQYSISYVDMHGRTIATALAGKPVTKMDTLASNKPFYFTKKLIDSTTNIINGTSIESSKGLVVTRAGDHRFKYSLLPDSINIKDCGNIDICYDCSYDLEITITDECNNSTLPGGLPYKITASNLTIDTTCNANTPFPGVDQSVYLREGNYLVAKKLTIRKKAMDTYRNIFLRRNTCKTLDQFIAEQKAALNMQCQPSCASCNTALGTWETFRPNYMQQMGIAVADSAAYRPAALLAWNKLSADCEELCKGRSLDKSYRDQMLADVTAPDGQYADPEKPTDGYSVFLANANGNRPYQNLSYLDGNGFSDPLNPQSLSVVDFSREFKKSWANTLLTLHPEYAKLMLFEQWKASHEWDLTFENTETYQEALARGYLNPASFTGLPANAKYTHQPLQADPLFTNLLTTAKTAMQDSLFNAVKLQGEPNINAWSFATIMAHCPDKDETCRQSYSNINQAFTIDASCSGELDIAWRYFREIYLQKKREIMDAQLNAYAEGIKNEPGYYGRLFASGHAVTFMSPAMAAAGQLTGLVDDQAEGKDSINSFILDNCRAYAMQWWQELKPCSFSQSDSVAIINKLIQVCKEGGDENHLFGVSTVKPSSTNLDRNFEQVIKAYAGSNYNTTCNVYLLTAPRPYENQPILYDKPIMQKPDSCECATISNLYTKYQVAGIDASFGDYIYRTTHTRIYDGVLDTLRKACSGEINCSFLKQPLSLPPVLQCGGGEELCVTCVGIDTLYTKFRQQFPQAVPSYDDADSLQRIYNTLFERFMNTNLGFGKKTAEYLDFIATCTTTSDKYCNLALAFDGNVGKKRVTIPVRNNRLRLGTGDFTLEARIKPKANSPFNAILTNRTQSGGTTGDGFMFILSNGQLLIQLQGCYNYMTSHTAGIDLYDGKPHQVAVSRQGDSLGFYVDGIKVPYAANCSGTLTTPPSQRNITTTGPWYIGLDSTGAAPNPLVGFNGWIDEVRVWNTARTPAQIAANLNVRLSPQPNLAAYYLLRSKDTCTQAIIDYSITDTRLRNDGYLGSSPAKDVLDPVWLSPKQISYIGADPVGVSNTCACTGGSSTVVCDSLQAILNDYNTYGGIPHLDASGADTTNWKINFGGTTYYKVGVPLGEVVKNGVLKLPNYYTDTLPDAAPYKYVDYDRVKDTLCLDSAGFTFETRLKLPDSLVIPNGYNDSWWISLYSDPAKSGSILVSLKLTAGNGSAICTHQGDPKAVCTPLYVPHLPLDNWRTVRLQFRKRQFSYYIDTALQGTATLDAPMTKLYWWTLLQYAQKGEVDYIRIYDTTGRYLYKEEFDDPHNLARPIPAADCNGCQPGFVKYFNQRTSNNYSYNQIQAIYNSTCGTLLGDCPEYEPVNTLCGRTEPVFPPAALVQHSPCDDSTLFAVSKGTLLYEAYRDSLINSFDNRYLAKCLNARYTESFTVDQPISEYHYTLYYYDQAGNLVKTISPQGVDVSKFAWAASYSDSVKTARRNRQVLKPAHGLLTQYKYNSLNQVVTQTSPDGGLTNFWYDRLGRLAISQNAKQRSAGSSNDQDRLYSYTKYDPLGRITEVGQMKNTSANGTMANAVSRNPAMLDTWLLNLNNRREQITQTIYDLPYSGFIGAPDPSTVIAQRNIRNRVSYITYTENSNPSAHNQATFYTYDILGNVDTLLQDYGCGTCGTLATYNMMNRNGNPRKKFAYQYDLISGKVNMMLYQNGWNDMWLHRYSYDAENRLILVETSNDSLVWEKDARYEYYRHGPLARTVIGDQLVQGIDYAYTLQGWLKGMNSTGSTATHDMGGDGRTGSINQYVARDALGFNLNYFGGEYAPINSTVTPFPKYYGLTTGGLPDSMYRPLYNGNISSMATYIRRFEGAEPAQLNVYKYDQLNRLTRQDVYKSFNPTSNSYAGLATSNMFRERVTYDANGNITTYRRNAGGEFDNLMDDLTYQYYPAGNQLKRIDDKVDANRYGSNSWEIITDIDGHVDSSNYVYDEIGNLIQDKQEKITNIKWTVYGKIAEITRNAIAADKVNTTRIAYSYDAQGNRISKVVEKAGSTVKDFTWYVRDAQGNLVATYKASGSVDTTTLQNLNLTLFEQNIYGSSRLGTYAFGGGVDGGPVSRQFYSGGYLERGWRQYELSNHLGNVLTTISDKKFGVSSGGIGTAIDYYEPDMVSANDYYPFGMVSRVGTSSTGVNYRFGFNGKEADNEVKGWQNQLDYGMRIYDPRVGRFLSTDPMSRSYSGESNYSYAGNSPIMLTDFDGYFKISPYFAKKYPSLTRVLQYYLPLLKDNPQVKAAWVKTIGFSSNAEGEKAFDEMVTFGSGPWITPTRPSKEIKSNMLSRFAEPAPEGEWSEAPAAYADNLAISYFSLEALEAAIKKGDDKEIGTNMFIVSTVIMHEATHWGKWKYNCCEANNYYYEKGATFEENAFGQRFSYRHPNIADMELNALDKALMNKYSSSERGRYGSPSFGLTINSFNKNSFYWRFAKTAPLSSGQLGDPVVIENRDEKKVLPKPYQQKEKAQSSNDKTTYNH